MNAPATLAGADLAAVMVTLLDDRQAADLLARLSPAELELLGERMCAIGEISPEAIVRSVASFAGRASRLGIPAQPREPRVRALMAQAVGDIKADSLMQRIVPETGANTLSSLEILRWLTPQALQRMVAGEPAQVTALLLVQIDAEVAAQVLYALPNSIQSEVVHRIATLGHVAPAAIAMLEELVARKLREPARDDAVPMGGPRDAANIINSSGKAMEKRVMPDIQKRDRQLARTIEDEMFKFEHLFVLDGQAMGALLREVESEVLIDALKGIGEADRDHFFRAMSSRAADGLRDEINDRGRLKLADVVAAQKQVVAAARRLAAEGVISLGKEEDDYV